MQMVTCYQVCEKRGEEKGEKTRKERRMRENRGDLLSCTLFIRRYVCFLNLSLNGLHCASDLLIKFTSLLSCCVLRAACCVLRAACCVLRVACCVLRVACCVLRVACWWCCATQAAGEAVENGPSYGLVFVLSFEFPAAKWAPKPHPSFCWCSSSLRP